MTRRIKRAANFEIALQIKNEIFIRPPRDAQRHWLLNTALEEFSENLNALDELATRFVPGTQNLALHDRSQAALSDEEIMEDWQIPIMQAMAKVVTESHGSILEIGFGRGVSSGFIQDCGVKSHTIIECNDTIVNRFDAWRKQYPNADLRIVHGLWQDVLEGLGRFDGIFFHTYPLNEVDFIEQIGESTTFADHFFPHAAKHLVDGGIFTYLSNEMDSLRRAHQRLLFRHFRSISMQVMRNLKLPEDVHDAWWADSMVVVKAVKQAECG